MKQKTPDNHFFDRSTGTGHEEERALHPAYARLFDDPEPQDTSRGFGEDQDEELDRTLYRPWLIE